MKQRKKQTTSQTNRETKKARMAENLEFCRKIWKTLEKSSQYSLNLGEKNN